MHTLYSVKCVPDIAWDILTLKEHGCCSEAHMWLGVLYSVRQTPRRRQDERAGRNLPGHSASHSAVAEDGTGCRRWGKAAQRRRADCPGCRDTRGRTEGAARRARPSCWLCVVGQEGGHSGWEGCAGALGSLLRVGRPSGQLNGTVQVSLITQRCQPSSFLQESREGQAKHATLRQAQEQPGASGALCGHGGHLQHQGSLCGGSRRAGLIPEVLTQ